MVPGAPGQTACAGLRPLVSDQTRWWAARCVTHWSAPVVLSNETPPAGATLGWVTAGGGPPVPPRALGLCVSAAPSDGRVTQWARKGEAQCGARRSLAPILKPCRDLPVCKDAEFLRSATQVCSCPRACAASLGGLRQWGREGALGRLPRWCLPLHGKADLGPPPPGARAFPCCLAARS